MNIKFWSRFLAIFLILAVTAGTASAQVTQPADTGVQRQPLEKLSFRLAALADSASLRGAGTAAQASALSLPESGPGSLMRSGGQIMVNVRMSDLSAPAIQALSAAGARPVHVSERYQTAVVYISPANLQAVASLPAVLSLEEEFTPQTGSWRSETTAVAPTRSTSAAPTTECQGANVTEGDVQLKAVTARSTYTLDGSGVKIGILSDSYDKNTSASTSAADDIASGDLPGIGNPCLVTTPVNVLDDTVTGSDEGRGMLQIVHDLAPKSQLSFATAFVNLFSFADNVRALRDTAGADIIADDVFYYREPFFQEGPVNVAISDVVQNGALYFALAGNHNIIDGSGNNISSYEAPIYRPTACPAAITGLAADCHNFGTSGAINAMAKITLGTGGKVNTDFQWAEPWYGVTTDLDIYLLNSTGSIVAYSYSDNTVTQNPFELMYFENSSGPKDYYVVIARASGSAAPRLKYIFLQGTYRLISVEYNTSAGGDIVGPTLYGHSATTAGISVGAIPYNDSNNPEYFTSRGPSVFYFGPVVSTTPAAAIIPMTMNQPDIAATDGGCTTFFGDFDGFCNRFYGTSAATPHAAAASALILQRAKAKNIVVSRNTIIEILQETAQPVSGGTPASVGAGMLDAMGAIEKLDTLLLLSRSVFIPSLSR